MANIPFNKNAITLGIFRPNGGLEYIKNLPTTQDEGRPSLAVAQAVAEILKTTGASAELVEAFADWMERAYPQSLAGSPGAKAMEFGATGRAYKASVLNGDENGTANVRIPVAHIGVRHGGKVRARAMNRHDAIALLNRLDDERVIFLVPDTSED